MIGKFTSRVFGMLLAGLLALSPAGAVAPSFVTVGSAAWVDLGVGPILVQPQAANVMILIADVQPSAASVGQAISPQQPPQTFNTTSHVWARMYTSPYGSIVVVVNPVVTAGGGGGGAITAASGAFAAGALAAGAGADGWDLTQGAKADAPYAGSGSASIDAILKGIYAAAVGPLAGRSGAITQSSISVTNASTALLTAAQFTNFEKICVPFTASTGVWINWANAAAVAAAPSEYVPPGQCDTWVGSTGFIPTTAAFAISNSAATIAVTVEGN